MMQADAVVAGAGVVGLAVARQLAMAGREVVIIEKNAAFGEETSARNSEVIHAGIYYPAGWLKSETCVAGRAMLYDYCREHGVSHEKIGKLIVATDDSQMETLARIRGHAHQCGVPSVDWISADKAKALEPELFCVGALFSPETGIIDSHGLMLSLLGDAEAQGAMLALSTPIESVTRDGDATVIECGGEAPATIRASLFVNAAGLRAPRLAGMIWPDHPKPPEKFARGNYFTLTAGRSPFSRLVYPVPEPGGLGVHFTRDLGGRPKFGPDVEWIDGLDYRVNESRADAFQDVIRRYWPGLPDDALVPDYTGIRPKILGPDGGAGDFIVAGHETHGQAGVVHMLGIESPGLTASLALADLVTERLGLEISSRK